MVYKRYIRRNGKLVGPYYYKTVKEKNGKTRTIYIGRTVPAAEKEEKTTIFYESNVSQLKKNIQLCDAKKEVLRINLNKLLLRYQNKEISYGQYELLKNKYLKGKTPEHWYNYYDGYKGEIQDQIKKYLFASSCLEYIKTVSDTGKELEKAGEEKQKIPQAFKEKILQLQNNALVCEQRKIQLRKRLQEYKQRYDSNLINYSQYELLKNSYLKGKTPEYWFSYYDNQKLDLQEQVNKYKVSSTCEGYAAEIFEAKPSLKDKVLTEIVKEDLELEELKFYDKHRSLTQIVSVLIIALVLLPSLIFMIPAVNESYSERHDGLVATGFTVIDDVEDYANKGAGLAFDVLKSSFRFLESFSPTGFAITTGLGNGSSTNYKLTFASIGSIGDSGSSSNYNVNVSGDAAWETVMGNGSSSGYVVQLGYLRQPINTAPAIIDISDIPAVTLSEGLVTPVEFSFLVDDQDGISDILNESVEANFSKDGETTRWNTTHCEAVVEGTNATAQNYTCTIDMQYWDGAGTWNVNVQGGDEEFNVSKQETFTVGTTTAINISATTLSWAQLFVGNIDNMMSTAEENITNTGNQNLTSITLEAVNLIGETTNTVWIPAANFTATWGERSCSTGTAMVNDSATAIGGAALDFGPGSLEPTNNATHICLEEVGQDITQQSYSTADAIEDWTLIGVV